MKITDVRCLLLSGIIPEEKRWISDLGLMAKQDAAIAVVETDEGVTGYGECKGTAVVMKTVVEQVLKPLLVGQDPTRVEYLWEKMYSAGRLELSLKHGRPYHRAGNRGETIHAISGVDIALWDAFGKSLGLPVYKLLGGGVRERVMAYASGGWAPPEKTAEEVGGYREKGFRAVKIRVGGLDEPSFPRRSWERLRIARDTLGSDAPLMMDAHGGLTIDRAIRLARGAEEVGITWFEEPVLAADDPAGLAEVRRTIPMPVSTGESETTRFAFKELIELRAADVLQPDVSVCGGITEMRRIAALALAHGFVLAPHNWGSALLFVASLQVTAATPNAVWFEYPQGFGYLLQDLLAEPLPMPDAEGWVPIPSGPGLGIALQPEADLLKKFPYQPGPSYQTVAVGARL